MLCRFNEIMVIATLCILAGSCTWESIHRASGSDCNPTTCDLQGNNCEEIPDGCGGTTDCGTCDAGVACGAAAFANLCCFPTTCFDQVTNCGIMPTGCGDTENCGDCGKTFVCGGGARPNVCGAASCTPTTCAELGYQMRTRYAAGGQCDACPGDYGDSFVFSGQLGWFLVERLLVALNVNGVLPFAKNDITKAFVVGGPSVYLEVAGGVAVEASFDPVLWARASSGGVGFSVGVSYKRDAAEKKWRTTD
ncbi:MAG: hypothetical protein V3T05_01600 [Myxococcota bacterium]